VTVISVVALLLLSATYTEVAFKKADQENAITNPFCIQVLFLLVFGFTICTVCEYGHICWSEF